MEQDDVIEVYQEQTGGGDNEDGKDYLKLNLIRLDGEKKTFQITKTSPFSEIRKIYKTDLESLDVATKLLFNNSIINDTDTPANLEMTNEDLIEVQEDESKSQKNSDKNNNFLNELSADDEQMSVIVEKDKEKKFLNSPKFVILTTLQRFKNKITDDFSLFLKSAIRAKSISKPNSLCRVIAQDSSELFRNYNAETVKLYKMVKKDINDVVNDIHGLVYGNVTDEKFRNNKKNHFQKRMENIYQNIQSHEYVTKNYVTEIDDIHGIGVVQSQKLYSHFLAKKIKEKFSEYLIESTTTRKILRTTFDCMARELNNAMLITPRENKSFFISKLVDEEDRKRAKEIFGMDSNNDKKNLVKHFFTPTHNSTIITDNPEEMQKKQKRLTITKCKQCDYETHLKKNLVKHMTTHQTQHINE